MAGVRSIKDLNMKGKRVFMRVDFNVPLDDNGKVRDDTRIVKCIPSIGYALQEGAKLVLKPEDILEELNLTMVIEQTEARQVLPADETEASLLTYLSAEPTHVDELRQQVDLPIAQVTSTLAMMELKGMVRQVSGMKYVVARERGVEYVVD